MSRPKDGEALGRLAAALASTDDAGTRLETRLTLLTIASRAITVTAGVLFGLLNDLHRHGFLICSAVLIVYAIFASYQQLRTNDLNRVRLLTLGELIITVGVIMLT